MKPLGKTYRRLLAKTFNSKIRPSDRVLEIDCGNGELLTLLNGSQRVGVWTPAFPRDTSAEKPPGVEILSWEEMENQTEGFGPFDVIVFSNTLNYSTDVEGLLAGAKRWAHPKTRVLINAHNTLWRPVIRFGQALGVATAHKMENWLSKDDIANLAELADWDLVHLEMATLVPLDNPVAAWVNRWIAPLLPFLCLSQFFTYRQPAPRKAQKVSIVIPTRNEAGTIKDALDRIPHAQLGCQTEVIFVEGNSTDNTWEVVSQLPDQWGGMSIVKAQQENKGKGDAVRKGFSLATGDILLILDGDLTMPPEDIPKYVKALESGKADFANGSRLVYNMEAKAMRLANLIANKFFGMAFSWILGQQIKDTLCGTKVLWAEDYRRIEENRSFFGDFDPFGDFDLLFGAAKQNLKIRDIPIHYKERKYGETNIQRWRHGVILLRMMIFAARKLKFKKP